MRLTAQQLRFVRLLECTAPELEEAVDRELEDNPALTVEDAPNSETDTETSFNRYAVGHAGRDVPDYEFSSADSSVSLYDYLSQQITEKDLPDNIRQIALYIIGSLDPNGYLRRPLANLVNDMDFREGMSVTLPEAEKALEVITDLEPYGVGARDLRECLLIQLRHMPRSQQRDDALRIIGGLFEEFTLKHTHRIISGLKIGKDRVRDAINLIVGLNPKPGASFSSEHDAANIIIPDLIVSNEDGVLSVSTASNIPELAIDHTFSEIAESVEEKSNDSMSQPDSPSLKGSEFVVSRYNDARDFISILKQRQRTLLAVMSAIMTIQKDYFQTQDIYRLKPMILKDVAVITGLDLSVISRATNNKYVSTPWGIFPLRFFFSDSIGDDNNESNGDNEDSVPLTNRKIEAEIKSLVEHEDKAHPLSDEKIRVEMEAKGYDVSRRTVAKYRDRVGIPVARLRKEL